MTHQLYQVSWVTTSCIGLYFLQKLLRVAALVLLGTGAAEDFPTKISLPIKASVWLTQKEPKLAIPLGKLQTFFIHIFLMHTITGCVMVGGHT